MPNNILDYLNPQDMMNQVGGNPDTGAAVTPQEQQLPDPSQNMQPNAALPTNEPEEEQGPPETPMQKAARDAVGFSVMLRHADEDEKKKIWPSMAKALQAQVPYQAKALGIDPNSPPPTDEMLDHLLKKSGMEKYIPKKNLADEESPILQAAQPAGYKLKDSPSAYAVPKGYMMIDPTKPELGVTPIPGGPHDPQTIKKKRDIKNEGKPKVSPEVAAKVEGMKTAKWGFAKIDQRLFRKDGSVDRSVLFHMDLPLIPGQQSLPGWFSEDAKKGRQVAGLYEQGIQAITRGETGAAMPESEVGNTRKRFMPNWWDDDETVLIKYQMYKMYINGYLSSIYKGLHYTKKTTDKYGNITKTGHIDTALLDGAMQKYKIQLDEQKKNAMREFMKLNQSKGATMDDAEAYWKYKLKSGDIKLKPLKEAK